MVEIPCARNPEAAAARGIVEGSWISSKRSAELNPKLKNTQFADYHGHGWVFKAVFKKDRHGNLLDLEDKQDRLRMIPKKWQKAVHLNDIAHPERACSAWTATSCATTTATARSTSSRARRRASSASTATARSTSGPRSLTSGNGGKVNLADGRVRPGGRGSRGKTVHGTRHGADDQRPGRVQQYITRKVLYQYSNMDQNKRWEVPQTVDTVDPLLPACTTRRGAYAKTLAPRWRRRWGDGASRPAASG